MASALFPTGVALGLLFTKWKCEVATPRLHLKQTYLSSFWLGPVPFFKSWSGILSTLLHFIHVAMVIMAASASEPWHKRACASCLSGLVALLAFGCLGDMVKELCPSFTWVVYNCCPISFIFFICISKKRKPENSGRLHMIKPLGAILHLTSWLAEKQWLPGGRHQLSLFINRQSQCMIPK